jgi:hypothetical protein
MSATLGTFMACRAHWSISHPNSSLPWVEPVERENSGQQQQFPDWDASAPMSAQHQPNRL